MGAVYKAYDVSLGRRVALKVLRQEFCQDTDFISRLDAEARVTASINHPHVVRVFRNGASHGMYYITFELIEGGSLDAHIKNEGRISESRALEFGIQVASGLEAAAAIGMIHRDIKPGNILLSNNHHVKIVDFGIAKRVRDAALVDADGIWASPYYLAPEKLRGEEDIRSDMYSLGATLFHALTGRPLFEGDDGTIVALKHLKSNHASVQAFAPYVSATTASCLNRMLQKTPEARFQSYDELIRHLQFALDRCRPSAISAISVSPHRRRLGWKAFAAVGAIIVAMLAVILGREVKNQRFDAAAAELSTARRSEQPPGKKFIDAVGRLAAGDSRKAAELFRQYRTGLKPGRRDAGFSLIGEGIAFIFSGDRGQSQQVFKEVSDYRSDQSGLGASLFQRFADRVGGIMIGNKPVPRDQLGAEFDHGDYRVIALFLAGLKNLELGEYEDGIYFLRRFSSAHLTEDYWVSELKVCARDASIAYIDLERLASGPDDREKIRQPVQTLGQNHPFLSARANEILRCSSYEAESSEPDQGARVLGSANASGGKVMGNTHVKNAGFTWTNVTRQGAGNATLSFRYATADNTAPVSLFVNGAKVSTITFLGTGGWESFGILNVTVSLRGGTNTVAIINDTASKHGVNIDRMDVY